MTFSIIGFDPLKNRFGVAVSSCHIAVGSTVSFVRSQVGAVATQGQTNPYLGLRSLESLQSCSDSKIVLENLIKEDFGREKRQVHLIDKYGRSACWTGQECFQTSGHISGENFSVAGNFLENIEVLEVMADVFKQSDPNIKLGKRLLDALNAGENIGGDRRSPRSTSSALKVSGELGFPLLDLRVDYHDSSVDELIRIYRHSQSEWAQEWRDSMNDLPEMNMKREFRVA